MKHPRIAPAIALALTGSLAQAQTASEDHSAHPSGNDAEQITKVEMFKVTEDGQGEGIGHVTVRESDHGLIFEPSLQGLSPGMHGFHIHENASCDPKRDNGDVTPGGAAGSHYDPDDAGAHGEPWGDGHKGDLPALYVDQDGTATKPVLSPRLEAEDLKGRSLMIHANGDNYADEPKPLGGGGARVACGVFEEE